jgi:hypothetical protein
MRASLAAFVLMTVALASFPACGVLRPKADAELERPGGTQEFLDERSGDRMVLPAAPLVFARDRSDVAAHGRDFATLLAVETSNGGKYSTYLLLYRWSTVDRRMLPPPDPQAGKLRLSAEGRVLELDPLESVAVNLAPRPELHLPKTRDYLVRSYAVDAATLSFLALSREPTLRLPQEVLDTPFALWGAGQAELRQFLQRTAAP